MKTSFSNKLFLCAAALAIGILGHTLARAQPTVEAWVQRYNGMAESDDRAQKTVLDSSGNVIVVGSSDAGTDGSDWLILKYSSAGVPLWTNRHTGPDNSVGSANAAAADGSGNVIATGYSYGSGDYVTIKYSGAGVPLWTNRYNGPGNYWGDITNAVAVDGSGNAFVTGGSATIAYSSTGVPLWTNLYPAAEATGLAVDDSGNVFVTGRAGDYDDFVTTKYSGAGVPLWTNRYIMCGYGHGYAVAVDGSGNVFVTGSTDCSGSAIIAYSTAGVPLWTNYYNGQGYGNDAPTTAGLAVDDSGNVFVTGSSSGSGVSDYVTVAYSNAGVPLWTNHYHGPANGKDIATGVALEGSGNVYVTGSSVGSGGYYDYATIKYSGTGVPLWTNRYTGPGDSHATAVVVDGSGNVFVTGYSWSGRSYDDVTISYSSAGAPLWTNRYNRLGETDDQPRAVAVDSSGNVFVTGSSSGSGVSDYVTFAYSGAGVPLWTNRYTAPGNSVDYANAVAVDGNGNVIVTGTSSISSDAFGSSDYATIKYSSAGVPLWTNRYHGPGRWGDEPTAVAVDASGDVFVTGASHDSDGYPEYATIKYSSAGVPLWTNRYSGPKNGFDYPRGMAVDGSGNVVVTGESWSGNSSISSDYVTLKYSGAGAPLWTNRYNGPANSADSPNAVAVDGSGNVFVTGESGNGSNGDYATIAYSGDGMPLWTNRYPGGARALAVDGSGNVFVTGGSGGDYATIKYSGAGVPLWTNRYIGPTNGYAYASALAVDGSGNVVVTGNSRTNGSADSIFPTIKYSSAGVPLWTNRYSGPANGPDSGTAIAVDASGNVFVTGQSWNGRNYDYVTVKYSSAGVPLLTIARTTTNTVAVSWPSPAAAFTLQQNTNGVASLNWSNVVTTPADDGTTKTVVINPPAESAFYRLIHP